MPKIRIPIELLPTPELGAPSEGVSYIIPFSLSTSNPTASRKSQFLERFMDP